MRFPHPLTLLVGCVVIAAALSYVLPAGRFERREDPATGRNLVVAGTYHRVDPTPVNAFQALVAIPKGMADAGAVIFYVFLVGGAFAVVEKTGASTRLVHWLVERLESREVLVIPIASLVFGLGGVLIQMSEELIASVPMLILIVQRIFTPVAGLPVALSALGMMGMQTLVHFPVPSTSGQAVLTLPVLVPLSDLLGLSREVTVLAYQYGAGLCELLTPTNGALMAMLAATGVRYDEWMRFALRLWGALFLLGAVAILTAIVVRI